MDRTLFVLIGAGASFDCTSPEYVIPVTGSEMTPPLVTQLFEPRFSDVLRRYPLAQMAASTIRSHRGDSVAIEAFLREHLRDSAHPTDRRKFHAIHFYLQDLLIQVSAQHTHHPDNYDRLIEATERLPRVVYISLNYDTILDDRLRHLTPDGLRSIGDYWSSERNWNLVKPHGSVDWIRPIRDEPARAVGGDFAVAPGADLEVEDGGFLVVHGVALGDRRVRSHGGKQRFFYPAISAPLGSPDPFTCPNLHIDFLRAELQRQDALDILMLGYSGLDDEVLKLFAESGKPLGHLQAVAGDQEQAQTAMFRLAKAVYGHDYGGAPVASEDTFSRFVTGSGLDDYLARRTRGA